MADKFIKNAGQAGAPFDPYNFSEIEKIQLDIERDLHSIEPLVRHEQLEPPGIPEPSVKSISAIDPISAEIPEIFDMPPSTVPAESFYKETIKQDPPPGRVRSYRHLIVVLLVICTIGTGTFGIGVGFGIAFWQQRMGISDQLTGNNLQEEVQSVDSSRFIFDDDGTDNLQEGTLADVVRLVDPAVVRVSQIAQNQPPFPFIGDGDSHSRGNGSGIIFKVDEERVFIVTSDHVLRRAVGVNITIMDSDPISAGLVGRSQANDLAVLYVYLADVRRAGISNLSVAVFGDSDAMQVGDVVLAIGNAMGEGNSTTSGIVSASEKEIDYGPMTLRVLQTDAAINPGSSGGPLVNKQGEVIGINTLLGSIEHYAIEGMGFSIPSNVAKPVIEEIMNQVPRPFLGIEGINVDDRIAANFGIPPIGILVDGVIPGTGADRAGIRRYDVITSFNGRAVFDMAQLQAEIAQLNVGDTVEVMVIREGREHLVLQVTLGENILDNF